MATIQKILRPQSHKEVEYQFQLIKDDWEQRYQAANSWKNVAEAILRQQKDKEDIAALLKQNKVSLAEKRLVVVSPEEFSNLKQDKKLKTKVVEARKFPKAVSPLEIRKVGQPHSGVPAPEEVQKDREAALQAAMTITGKKVKETDEKLRGKGDPEKMNKIDKDPVQVKKTSHQEKPHGPTLPSYQQAKQ